MARITFSSPGDMILKGLGLTVLGILLLGFGIGIIGAILGPYWVIKGMYWQYKLSTSGRKNENFRNQLQEMSRYAHSLAEQKRYDEATNVMMDFHSKNLSSLSPHGKALLPRQASYYQICNDNFDAADYYNGIADRYEVNADSLNIKAMISILKYKDYDAADQQLKQVYVSFPTSKGVFHDFALKFMAMIKVRNGTLEPNYSSQLQNHCQNCGNALDGSEKFCMKCGNSTY